MRAALERDPTGFASDDLTRQILERLNDEVSRLYDDGDAEDDDNDDADGPEGESDGEGAAHNERNDAIAVRRRDEGSVTSGSPRGGGGSRVELPKGPTPYELWRAAHEVDRTPRDVSLFVGPCFHVADRQGPPLCDTGSTYTYCRRIHLGTMYAPDAPSTPRLLHHLQRTLLTSREWDTLVDRLNASSRNKQLSLMHAQQKRVADELAGLSFKPAISERSRELAATNKSLPERVAALMRKKKARLDAIRLEKAQTELAEATFKPHINEYKPSRAAASAKAVQRKISHLLQFVSGWAARGYRVGVSLGGDARDPVPAASCLACCRLPRVPSLSHRTHTRTAAPMPHPSRAPGNGPARAHRPAPRPHARAGGPLADLRSEHQRQLSAHRREVEPRARRRGCRAGVGTYRQC